MEPLILMSESDKNLIDHILEFNKTMLKCAVEEPLNVAQCLRREAPKFSPSFAAMQEFGLAELEVDPSDFLIDGIVVDEERARATPCKCVKFNGKDLCWSPGVIGLLKQSQVAKYCPTKTYEAAPRLKEHLEEFKKVAEETKGLPLLERIAIMKDTLSKKSEKGMTTAPSSPASAEMYAEDDDEEEYPDIPIFDIKLKRSKIPPESMLRDLDTTVYPISEEHQKKKVKQSEDDSLPEDMDNLIELL